MKKKKIAQSFQQWLLFLVVTALLATTAFLWIFQTKLSEENAINILKLNISDVYADITDASNENLLELTRKIASELNSLTEITDEKLNKLLDKYDVTEISYVNDEGIIKASTYKEFIDFDMGSGSQASEFLVLLSGEKEYVQSYQPVSYDTSISRKYAGVVLEKGGFVQVGYGAERFQKDIDEFVVGVTRNRHIGKDGCIIIVDEEWNIVSDRYGNEGKKLAVAGIDINFDEIDIGTEFISQVYNEECYCLYEETEGYRIIAVMPCSEAALSRNMSVIATTVMQILIFMILFIMIYFLVNRLVVKNIYKVNESLSDIAKGELNTVVDVRSHIEFDELSDDINGTVDTLKRYIEEAEARIDAELALAKTIQHSALPSVFPAYPERKEFDMWATMHPAREVGGDFYDFYFVDSETLAVVIADVSGKGIPAAMFMMTSKTLLKSYAESGMSVEEVFTHANEKLCEGNETGMFVTAWMGFINIKSGVVTYVNAGHNPPLVKHKDGSFEYLRTRGGFVLAGMEGIKYRKHEIKLEPLDILYLYTDGVTEANNEKNELYGEERLLAVLNKNSVYSSGEICEAVKKDVDEFVKDTPQSDDITMLCFRLSQIMIVDAKMESINKVTAFVEEQLEKVDCPIKTMMQIDIAIDEIMSNIIKYAYKDVCKNEHKDRKEECKEKISIEKISVEVLYGKTDNNTRYVNIKFKDRGIPYNPLETEESEPDISLSAEEREIGGLGIFIVKKSMDGMEYSYENGENVLTIHKVI